MAWNPSPEVAVARDAAKRLGVEGVVIFVLDRPTQKCGYISYGKDRKTCDMMKHIADETHPVWMESVADALDSINPTMERTR